MQRHTCIRHSALFISLALALPTLANAQASDSTTPNATDLDNVVVTATRTAITADAALAAVEVIDRTQIEYSGAHSLQELLRGRAGITIVNQGGLGKLSTLFMRGTESDHTLFLIDGIRIGSPTSGLASLQDLPLEQIERIEIVRGPRSSLYGADAIGGVIQIFTRRGANAAGVHGHARIGLGSHGLREASAGLDQRGARGGIDVDFAHQSTDGINACSGYFDPLTFAGAGCFIVPGTHLDRDGYRNNSATLRADFKASEAWQFDARAFRATGHNDYDGDYVDNSDIVQQVVGGSVRWTPSAATQLKLTVGRNTDDSDNYIGNSFANRYDTSRESASLQGDFTMAAGHALTAGFDWLRDRANVVDPWLPPYDKSRGNRAVFAQYQGHFNAQDVQLSVRRDDNDQFGGHTTGGVAWGMGFGDGWRLTASHATAFKAPSFNELYYPGYSNPSLRPESSRSTELGLGQRSDGWHWQVNAYQTTIDDLIAYDSTLSMPNNIDRARIRGVELTAGTRIGEWNVQGQLGTLDARNLSTGFNRKRLARRPSRSARLDLDRQFDAWGFGISGVAEAARWDDVGNSLRVGGYGTLDARVSWRFANDWTLQANLTNAFDRNYQTSAYFMQLGRELALSVRWQPK